jgi:hypothetical protein
VPDSQGRESSAPEPTVLRATPQQRGVSISFIVIGVLLGVVMLGSAFTPNSGEGIGVPIEMATAFFALAALGLSLTTSKVVCDKQQISVRRWFRTKVIARNSIESITAGPVRTTGIAETAGKQLGIQIKIYGRRRPYVPGCLRTYDTKRNRQLLTDRLTALTSPPEYNSVPT